MSAEKVASCIKYKKTFDTNDMETAKIEHDDRKKACPIFKAEFGVEGLFHVYDKYMKIGRKLGFNGVAYWDNFDEVLDTEAEQKWEALANAVAVNRRTEARFRETFASFLQLYTST